MANDTVIPIKLDSPIGKFSWLSLNKIICNFAGFKQGGGDEVGDTSKPTMEIVGSLFLCAKDVPSLPEAQVLEIISLICLWDGLGTFRTSWSCGVN